MNQPNYDEAQKGEIATDLQAMYTAARDDFPDRADAVAKIASILHDLASEVDVVSAQASDPPAFRDCIGSCTDVLNALVRTAESLNAGAVGIKHVADTFVATDDYARSVYRGLNTSLTHFQPHQATVPGEISTGEAQKPGDLAGDPVNPTHVDPKTDLDTRDRQYHTDEGQVIRQTGPGLGQWEVHTR